MANGLIDLTPVPKPMSVQRLDLGGADHQEIATAPIHLGHPAQTRARRSAQLAVVAVVVSALLHMAAAATLVWSPMFTEAGAGGDFEAAGVELVPTMAVESLSSASGAEAASSEQVNADAGEESKETQPPIAETDTSLQDKVEPAALEAKTPDGDVAGTTEPKPEDKQEESATKTEEGQGKDDSRNTAQDAMISGGAASRGTSEIAAVAEATAAASEGEMSRYAADVYGALIRQRPRHGGSGRVKVEFMLTSAGIVSDAAILRSSGDVQLDTLAVNAVRNARFPRPPARANQAQLRYTTVIKFR